MTTAIIGGGASGMIAAIVSAQCGNEVTIFEHMPRMGKKLLLTGSGKCNISNTDMDISHFHGSDIALIKQVLQKCPPEQTLAFFERLGLFVHARGNCLYPYCDQASAVVDVLRFAIRDLGVDVLTDTDIRYIQKQVPEGSGAGSLFVVVTDQGRYLFDRVIICTGSASNRNTGSDGSGYELARSFGHKINKPLPALTHLSCEEDFFPSIAGIRTGADISIHIDTADGKSVLLGSEAGELQLVRSGISGIPVFNLSHLAVRALDEGKKVKASLDLLPKIGTGDIKGFLTERITDNPERTAEELFIGVLAKPLGICICKRCGIGLKTRCADLTDAQVTKLCGMIKKFEVTVTGSGGFESSQVLQGGVDLAEVTQNLESRLVPGLFFAGEVLDVNGDCGGYNLQWAASSAMVAAGAENGDNG